MRSLVVVILMFATTAAADAKTRHPATKSHGKQHVTHAKRVAVHGPIRGQSVGPPWQGQLRDAAQLVLGDGFKIRRPWRSYGTRATVDFVQHVVTDVREQFPDAHVFAIGDLSAKDGGRITEHRSHQSGRDADIGLIYKEQPAGFPTNFVSATAENLDCEATYALVTGFADTAHQDGGAQVMFLDYNVQGLLYRWAKEHDVDDAILDHLFQYPHRNASTLVRHEPNHDNHLHVRFKCPSGDSACQP